jgi:hypothetical protein
MTPCSQVDVQCRFEKRTDSIFRIKNQATPVSRKKQFLLSGLLRKSRSGKSRLSVGRPPCFLLLSGLLLGLLFNPEDGSSTFFEMTVQLGLRGVTSQRIVLFMVTAVRTSNPIRDNRKRYNASLRSKG